MKGGPGSADPIWERKYAAGHTQQWPWDSVVSFVFRHAPRDRPRSEVQVLEVGCGTGSNVWFAAREGFAVSGIDASPSAIAAAQDRLSAESLTADLRIADFTELPFANASFDLVIDRAALTCVGRSRVIRAIAEIARVSKTGARFLFTPYAESHSSRTSGTEGEDGLVDGIAEGTVAGSGALLFVSRGEIPQLLGSGWSIERLVLREDVDVIGDLPLTHAEWHVVAVRR